MSTIQPLANVENALKRKASSEDGVSNKKATPMQLKSISKRKMSVEKAKEAKKKCSEDLKLTEKMIRDKQKEVRQLKKKLKEAESSVSSSKMKKESLGRQLVEFTENEISDVERIMRKATLFSSATHGEHCMADMFTLYHNSECTEDDIVQLAHKIGTSNKEELQGGALQSLRNQPELLHPASKALCGPILENGLKFCPNLWPIVAEVVTKAGMDTDMLATRLVTAAEQMKKQDPFQYGVYKESKDKCPILDLLVPTCEAIPSSSPVKPLLQAEIKKALQESVNSPSPDIVNYSMPEEATIASKNGFKEMAKFLLSSTETELPCNYSKSGRMAVHRLIDNQIGSSKLKHESEGSGRDRILIVRKAHAPPKAQVLKRQERTKKHKELLSSMF